MYKQILGNRAEVVDLSDVEIEGTIIQHTKKSYSRSSLEGSVEQLNEKLDDERLTLTFMNFTDKVKNGLSEIYYGKSEGFDSLKGKNLQIVGTPFKNQTLYLLMGRCLGMNVDKSNREFEYQNVEWNGFRFAFNTFSNKELRRNSSGGHGSFFNSTYRSGKSSKGRGPSRCIFFATSPDYGPFCIRLVRQDPVLRQERRRNYEIV